MGLFDKRIAYKPFEYPDAEKFVELIQSSIWNVNEFNFTQDISDFNTMGEYEREVVRRNLLAISQIELSIKTFWGKLHDHFPKAEFNDLGTMLAFQEVIHSQSYSKLLEILGLNSDFDKILEVPAIQGRVEYLQKYLKGSSDNAKQNYALNVALFSSFMENCSLFSQFFILKSFNKHVGYFKGVDNVISATMVEENLHAEVGAWIVGLLKNEYPDFFDDSFKAKMVRACKKAYDAEMKIVDWILNDGELSFLKRETINNYLKSRFNKSMEMMGYEALFEVDLEEKKNYEWFDKEVILDKHTDFFNQRPSNYSRDLVDITAESLF